MPRALDQRPTLPWRLGVAGILVLALVLTSQLYVWVNLWPIRITWYEAFLWAIPQLLVWALVVPGIIWLSHSLPVGRGPRAFAAVLFHLAASVLVALLALSLLDVSDRVLGWSVRLGAPAKLVSGLRNTIVHLHIGIAIYWVVLAIHHALHYYARSRERELRASHLEAQLAQAELQTLRMQLNPHFLFNTLNSIAVLMRHDVESAEGMLHRLSELLQSTLRHAGSHEVALAAELDYLQSYLEIEEIRFRDRLTVTYDIDESALDCRVPFLILQPLVENALRHGIAPRAEPGHLSVSAKRRDGRLVLTVADDGPGFSVETDGPLETGVGLSNTEARLDHLYGSDHLLELRDASGGGLEVRIEIPARPPDGDSGHTALPADAERRGDSA